VSRRELANGQSAEEDAEPLYGSRRCTFGCAQSLHSPGQARDLARGSVEMEHALGDTTADLRLGRSEGGARQLVVALGNRVLNLA
jgi:hypothetical protein